MKKSTVSTALLLTTLVLPQTALAGPPPPPVCSDFPRMGLEFALGSYAAVGLDSDLEDILDDHLDDIVTGGTDQVTEGAVLMVARHSKIVYHKAVGLRDGNTALGGSPTIAMPTNAIFDLESMTKPFTAAVVLEMQADGLLDIDDLVIDYLPEFEFDPALAPDTDKIDVTVRDLLRYTSGLFVDTLTYQIYGATDPYLTMSHEASYYAPNEKVMYSDLGYRLLAHLAEVAYADAHPTAQKTFRALVTQYVTGPLGMSDTDFEPLLTMAAKMNRVAGTGEFAHAGTGTPVVPGGYRRGEVQDDQDWWTQRHNPQFPSDTPTGTGCDGLFSTALDLGKFAQALLDGGQIWDPYNCEYAPFFASATVSGLLNWQTHDSGVPIGTDPVGSFTDNLINAHKAFGFELLGLDWAAAGDSLQGVYKTGGAGTFLIVDPLRDLFIVVLTNHGLPDPFDFADEFDAMIDEIGPDRIADSVALAVVDSGGSSS